jgi:hypothetical protein
MNVSMTTIYELYEMSFLQNDLVKSSLHDVKREKKQ